MAIMNLPIIVAKTDLLGKWSDDCKNISLFWKRRHKTNQWGGLQLVSLLLTAVNVTVSSNRKPLCDHKNQPHTQQRNISIHHMEVETDQRSLNHRWAKPREELLTANDVFREK